MKRAVAGMLVVAFVVLGAALVAFAATQEEAKAMVEKAYAYLQEKGKDDAYPEFSNPKGQFVKGDLYVFVLSLKGVNLADGGNPGFVGQNHIGLKDTNGKYFIKAMIQTARTSGTGWVDYMWLNPATKQIQAKTTYVRRIEGKNALIACGVLK